MNPAVATYLCQHCGTQLSGWPGQCTTCGHASSIQVPPPTDPFLGRLVAGRYKVVRRLGQGGMGLVYLAEQVSIGQKVALKFLNTQLSQDPNVVRRFLNEAKSSARVNHPNAVAIHEFGQDAADGALFISMEYVDGHDLKSHITRNKQLSLADGLHIALQVGEVLSYAHEQGVVHRDLKPENIMLRSGLRGMHAKVLDFGIARLIEEGTVRLTGVGAIAGTPLYMAPEQIQGKDTDARVDIYALGLNVYEMLAGHSAFSGKNPQEVFEQQVHRPLPLLSQSTLENLSAVDAVLQVACHKNPAARYGSMAKFVEALAGLSPVTQRSFSVPHSTTGSGTLVLPTAPEQGVPLEKTARPDRAPVLRPQRSFWVWLGLAAAGGVLALGAWAWQTSKSPAPPLAVSPTPVSPGQNAPDRQNTPVHLAPEHDHLLAQEIWLKANAEFVSGNFESARAILATVPEDARMGDQIAQLSHSLEDAQNRFSKARAFARRGDCTGAIRLFDALLHNYPALSAARREREHCAQMLPPATAD
ncbi:MAG: protein kinase domain-containing protein [Myxococcaceae bacterium]